MKTIVSQFKFGKVIGLLILANLLCLVLAYSVFTNITSTNWTDASSLFLIIFTVAVQLWLIYLLLTQNRRIEMDSTSVKVYYPLLPFRIKNNLWTDFDYYKTIEEDSAEESYEAIWLIKNNKLKMRISSFYYTNYSALKRNIKAPYRGKLELNLLKQIYCLFGGKI